jgi:hypothetical protein
MTSEDDKKKRILFATYYRDLFPRPARRRTGIRSIHNNSEHRSKPVYNGTGIKRKPVSIGKLIKITSDRREKNNVRYCEIIREM